MGNIAHTDPSVNLNFNPILHGFRCACCVEFLPWRVLVDFVGHAKLCANCTRVLKMRYAGITRCGGSNDSNYELLHPK